MKNLFLILLFLLCFQNANAQIRKRRDSTNRIGSPEMFNTDSARRGNEIYEGGKGKKSKSNGDTVKGYKRQPATKQSGSKKSASLKNKTSQNGEKHIRRVSLVMSDFKV